MSKLKSRPVVDAIAIVSSVSGPRVGARCACGATFTPIAASLFAAVLAELQEHVDRLHPDAIGLRLSLLVEPIAVRE